MSLGRGSITFSATDDGNTSFIDGRPYDMARDAIVDERQSAAY